MYTSHGHHIPGTIKNDDRPAQVARCGGPGLCKVCMKEAQKAMNEPNEDLVEATRGITGGVLALQARFGRLPTEEEVVGFLFGTYAQREDIWNSQTKENNNEA